jgi:hypothetical protein
VLDLGRKATKSGYFWAVVADDRGHGGAGPPIVLFHYAPGRGKAHPLQFLAGYRGRFLQCDAYQSYNALTGIPRDGGPWQLVYCWTHVRRRFVKRFENEGSPIAEEMLRQIALLYQVEKSVRGNEASVRLAARRKHSSPFIDALKPWLETQLSRIPQKSQLAEDIRYTLAHWPGLIRFLDDGTLELDTNPVENQIRPIALTMQNDLLHPWRVARRSSTYSSLGFQISEPKAKIQTSPEGGAPVRRAATAAAYSASEGRSLRPASLPLSPLCSGTRATRCSVRRIRLRVIGAPPEAPFDASSKRQAALRP